MRERFCSSWAEIHRPNGRGHFAKCHRSKRARWLTWLLLKAPTGTGATATSWSHHLLSMQMTTSIAALPRHRNLQQLHAVHRHRNRKYKCRINCVAFWHFSPPLSPEKQQKAAVLARKQPSLPPLIEVAVIVLRGCVKLRPLLMRG